MNPVGEYERNGVDGQHAQRKLLQIFLTTKVFFTQYDFSGRILYEKL